MCFLLLSLLMLKERFATGGRREGIGGRKKIERAAYPHIGYRKVASRCH